MEYVFSTWDTLINANLNANNSSFDTVSQHDIDVILKQSEQELTKQLQNLKKIAISQASKKKTAYFVQSHQADLTRLLDTLYAYQQKSKTKRRPATYTIIGNHLMKILWYMQGYFPHFFNQDDFVPKMHIHQVETTWISKARFLIDQLNNHEIDPQLSDCIKTYFTETIVGNKITYRELGYKNELMDELILITKANHSPIVSGIKKLLIYKNFNLPQYISYLVEQINKVVAEMADKQEKIKYLQWLRKEILQTPQKQKTAAVPHMLSLKEYLQNWINEEIDFLSKTTISNPSNLNQTFQLKFQSSVKVLAIIIRAFFDTSIIINENKRETLEWFAGHVSTVGTDTVSYKTLIKRGSKPEDRDKELAKDMLMRLFNEIRKH